MQFNTKTAILLESLSQGDALSAEALGDICRARRTNQITTSSRLGLISHSSLTEYATKPILVTNEQTFCWITNQTHCYTSQDTLLVTYLC